MSEFKETFDALAEKESQLEVIFKTSHAGMILVSPQGEITFANRRMAQMLGCTIDELLGSFYPHHVHPEERGKGDEGMKQLILGQIDHVYTERRYVRKDGSDFWGYLSGRRHEAPDGSLISLVGIITDITELRAAKELLRTSDKNYRQLYESMRDAYAKVLMDGRLIEYNAAFRDMLGYTDEELLKQTYNSLTPEKWHRAEAEIISGQVLKEGHSRIYEKEYRRKDGTVFPVELRTYLIRSPDGQPQAMWAIVRDITERKWMEAELRESENRHRTIIEGLQDVYYRTDAEGRVSMVNPAGVALMGYDSADEMLGCPIKETFYHNPSERDTFLARLKEKGRLDNYEVMLKKKDGTPVPVSTSSHLLFSKEKEFLGVEGTFRDMTEHHKLIEERIKSQKLESLGLLAGGIAHDFNNLLAAVMGNISLARLQTGEDHQAAQCLEECEKALVRASELTRQLIAFSKGGEPVKQEVETENLVQEALTFCLLGSNVKGALTCAPGLWSMEADSGQLNQVFNNLFINAKQAMAEGGPLEVTAENLVLHRGDDAQLPEGRYVRITVADRGVGIPPENLKKVFDPYFTTKPAGSGLGLSSVYAILKRHGGNITVSSKQGEGTTFTLLIPAGTSGAVPKCESSAAVKMAAGKKRILAMDDEEMIRNMSSAMLKALGYEPTTCEDGAAAVSLHAAALENGCPFDAIILDLTVPGGMGGARAAALIRQSDPAVPIIVSSGYSTEGIMADHKEHGFTGTMEKPYNLKTLGSVLGKALS